MQDPRLAQHKRLLRQEGSLEESLKWLATARNTAVELGLDTVQPEQVAAVITELDTMLQSTRRALRVVDEDLDARPLLFKFA